MIEFTLDPAEVVRFVVAFVLPVLVGLVTKRVTHAGVKAVILAGLTLASTLLVELGESLVAGTVYDLGHALLLALPAFVVSVATHFGLWKPTGVSAKAQAFGDRQASQAAAAHRAEIADVDEIPDDEWGPADDNPGKLS